MCRFDAFYSNKITPGLLGGKHFKTHLKQIIPSYHFIIILNLKGTCVTRLSICHLSNLIYTTGIEKIMYWGFAIDISKPE